MDYTAFQINKIKLVGIEVAKLQNKCFTNLKLKAVHTEKSIRAIFSKTKNLKYAKNVLVIK